MFSLILVIKLFLEQNRDGLSLSLSSDSYRGALRSKLSRYLRPDCVNICEKRPKTGWMWLLYINILTDINQFFWHYTQTLTHYVYFKFCIPRSKVECASYCLNNQICTGFYWDQSTSKCQSLIASALVGDSTTSAVGTYIDKDRKPGKLDNCGEIEKYIFRPLEFFTLSLNLWFAVPELGPIPQRFLHLRTNLQTCPKARKQCTNKTFVCINVRTLPPNILIGLNSFIISVELANNPTHRGLPRKQVTLPNNSNNRGIANRF